MRLSKLRKQIERRRKLMNLETVQMPAYEDLNAVEKMNLLAVVKKLGEQMNNPNAVAEFEAAMLEIQAGAHL